MEIMETFISELTKLINTIGEELPGGLKNKLVGSITGLHYKYQEIEVENSELKKVGDAACVRVLTEMLDGCQYRDEMSNEAERWAKENGLVVVFGASDDLTEFRGAIDEEMGAWDGRTHLFTKDGIFPDEDQMEALAGLKIELPLNKIEAVWSPKEPACSWIFKTDIPHSTFNVMRDGELYCIGIVFHINDLK